MNKVFEIARCFRNEGIDATHLQDFTMIEGYCAYYNYKDNMKFLREMLQYIIEKLFGTLAPSYKDRNGGYTKVLKTENRRGDNAPMAIVTFVK